MKKLTYLLALVILVSGCATINTIKQIPDGSGKSKTYSYPYDKVFKASINAIKNFQFEIIDINKASGYIYAQKRGKIAQGAGEVLNIRFTQIKENSTKVEVIARILLMFGKTANMDTEPLSPFHSESIFQNIEFELEELQK